MDFCYAVVKSCQLCSFCLLCTDPRCIGAPVFCHIILQCAFGLFRDALHDGPVIFSEPGRGELPVQFSGGGRRLREHEQPFHRLIQAVDDGEIRFAL